MTQPPVEELDALVIGAGVTGLYQLYCLRQLGVNARIYEAGEGVGGTWYWNRYPGARLDSESWSYAYSFSEELLQEWEWSESFVGQPELERYLNVVADKFQLRPHIRLGTRVQSAIFDENTSRWDVETEDGHRARAQHVIAAVGLLSATHMPDILGVESFEGESFHTSRWPHEPVDFAGKRVGVIGTGSTGVQVIPEVARECAHLTVFQRTPNYCVPLRNSPIDEEWQREIKANYHEVFERCRNNIGGFIHDPDPRSTFDVTPEEREAFYEDIWAQPGFAKWFGNFSDLMLDREANELYCEFVRNKIRERVNDPEVAEKLCPKDHHFGELLRDLQSREREAGRRARGSDRSHHTDGPEDDECGVRPRRPHLCHGIRRVHGRGHPNGHPGSRRPDDPGPLGQGAEHVHGAPDRRFSEPLLRERGPLLQLHALRRGHG
jgi:cation diffusion facilitator CzcD-associated flavoprotein CzcO